MDKSLIRTAQEAPSYAFQACYEQANNGLEYASFYFVDMVITKIAHRGTSNDVFQRSIEK